MKKLLLLTGLLFITSCTNNSPLVSNPPSLSPTTSPTLSSPIQHSAVILSSPKDRIQNFLTLPIQQYGERKTLKSFGEYIQDRFTGYHAADDIEFTDTEAPIPVVAIADGTVEFIGNVAGYGGVIRILHHLNASKVHAIYGHIALSSTQLKAGDPVRSGQKIAELGKGNNEETDGERKHLHFGLYAGEEERINGYEQTVAGLEKWLNPQDFFTQYEVAINHPSRTFDPQKEIGGNDFKLNFTIPAEWEVEYIPSLKALNLYTMHGAGSARERSQIFIRFFDAARFLTLTTVNVLQTKDLTVGKNNYLAKQYEIEKKAGVNNFPEQPTWRNQKHIVTDFRDKDGQTRYYVVAKSPTLSDSIYQELLASMQIIP
ncbi:MAG: M23 family metallopeptidase [Candidatus Abawacabacteria bacterium]|nr:M23 family metallopeptidase [Candidatus Abawacabacteria bacterium]